RMLFRTCKYLCALSLLAAIGAVAQTTDSGPRKLATVLFANLGTPANGTIVFCSDCTSANPAAGSGSGAVARRENGAWNSGGGSGSATIANTTLLIKGNNAGGGVAAGGSDVCALLTLTSDVTTSAGCATTVAKVNGVS